MNNKTKKALYKLISEEWLAANMYESMVLGCKAEARATIDKIFMTTADDEKNDHHLKLVRYAIQMDVDVPCRMDEYSKYAEEAVVKQFNSWKKNRDAKYYVEQALVAEEYAIESYTQIINDEDVDISLRNLILEMYYDEIEHLSQFKTLLIAINYGAMMA